MKFSNIGVALGIAAATMGLAAHAGDDRKASKDHRQAASGMQAVAVSPKAGEPGHGWQYFSDSRKARTAAGCRGGASSAWRRRAPVLRGRRRWPQCSFEDTNCSPARRRRQPLPAFNRASS
jgi:hypothetical protein